jgi:hypothetical protein
MLGKYFYKITGYTKDNEKILTYKSIFIEGVLKEFIEKYPNFKGKVDLTKCRSTILEDGLYSPASNCWDYIKEFNSTKEVKNYLKKRT